MSIDFSIIIPTFKSAGYIHRTIQSVLLQSHVNYEILVIDDCSDDGIEEVLSSFNIPEKLNFYVNEIRSGPNYSRNFGIDKARGDYILFLDSDDSLQQSALESLYYRLANAQYDMISFGFHFISDFDKIIGQPTFFSGEVINEKLIREFFRGRVSTVCWNKVYRTSFLRENELQFISDLVHGRDSIFTLKCCLNAKRVLFINEILYYSTVRPNSFSRVFTIKNLKSVISNLDLVRSISEQWFIDPYLVDVYVAKHIRYILFVSAFRLSFLDYINGLKFIFRETKIFILFRPHVILRNSIMKNLISILIFFPVILFPIILILKRFNFKPY